mmetsp:Transcript_21542/g.38899  ORF Transcript_21542/g.38899 Transcript_21542/m.38899 type:complete len:158 (-) Transcript_21542:255-728(-)|eukprot:CAMPEP_0201879720 /NCGR_PEP_ID=MMETSP0902-20130614/10537_1 /ASSEMBLY_ACC=CAM_ASM_000551 /TAXON_ID=420261 /ORGANISM="Thalassiosira antarctica, Strain CCMP982" /LENGTH=157 /DNA_ID=CAMNT_0048407625 /DNA_START=118 /DNA_END=591 /DNA_ORIENTATION=-
MRLMLTKLSNIIILLCLSLAATATSFSFEPSSSNKKGGITSAETLAVSARSAVFSGALLFGLVVPAASAGDVGRGELIFRSNCAVCHPGGQNVIIPDKSLQKEALEKYLSGGMSEESVMRQVENGKNAMPAFGGRLGNDDIGNVASYVIASSEAGWE